MHSPNPDATPSEADRAAPSSGMRMLTRCVGATLCLIGFLPLARWLLAPERTGPAGIATVAAVDALTTPMGIGALSVLLVLFGSAFLPSLAKGAARIDRPVLRLLGAGSNPRWSLVCGLIAFAGAALTHQLLLQGEPTLVDEMAQLAEARDLGGLQPEVSVPAASIRIQNGLMLGDRWVSIYPPAHTWILAVAMRAGLLAWAGALLWGVAVGLSTSLFQLIARDAVPSARLSGLLLAVSPMGWMMGGGYLSHLSAACAIALALRCCAGIVTGQSVMGREAGGVESGAHTGNDPGSALLSGALLGAAAGWAVTSRPLTGLILAVLLPAGWLLIALGRRALPALLGAVLGGIPFAIGLGIWNQGRFGSPLTFGYEAAFGPAHGLGFHLDPWGNHYGVVEAIGYTFSDLFLLGSSILETPISAVGLIGLLLFVVPASAGRRGVGLAAAWIGAAVLANALYWHHGLHFGPRMLFETLPAWTLLLTLVAGHALNRSRENRWGVPLRLGLLITALGAVTLNLPARLSSASVGEARSAQLPPVEALSSLSDSTVVFVHGSWASRVSARLAQAGIRADSIETALRRNDLCLVDQVARILLEASAGVPAAAVADRLDWEPLPGTPSSLEMVEIGPGNRIRVSQSPESMPPSCRHEIEADRLGGLELEAVRWRTGGRHIIWLRDLGPEFNPVIPDARLLAPAEPNGRPSLMDYDTGIGLLWGPERPAG